MNKNDVFVDATGESKDPFEFLLDVTRRYGEAVRYTSPHGVTYLLNNPDCIGQVLQSSQFHRTSLAKILLGDGMLSSDGEFSKIQRQRAQPFFSRNALKEIQPLIQDRTQALVRKWHGVAERKETLDVSSEMAELTLTIIGDALFGVDLRSHIEELMHALDVLLNDIGEMGCTQINSSLTFTRSSRERLELALTSFDRIVWEIIYERRRLGNDPTKLLSFLLSFRDEATGEPLTDKQLRDEVATLLVAGFETTSLALSWSWYLLARNPTAERRVHEELDRELGRNAPNFKDLANLPYTQMVLRESMRLYPPVWFIARKTIYAGEIGGTYIPDNVLVIVSPYAIHRHPKFWKNPDEFDPLRFSPESHYRKNAYIPFGGGHHQCIGMNLALLESHFILACIAQNFVVRPLRDRAVRPQPAISLRLRGGLISTLSSREKE